MPGYARRVIVVVGDPILQPFDGHAPAVAGGPAAAIARACALAGAVVQLAGRVGDDPAGDEVLLSLTRDGVGHVALLRVAGLSTGIGRPMARPDDDPARPNDLPGDTWALQLDEAADRRTGPVDLAEPGDGPAAAWPTTVSALAPQDLDLALRYLIAFGVLVVAEPVAGATLAVATESAAYSGAHLVIVGSGAEMPTAPADAVTVLEPPSADPDGDFAAVVARYAVALDGGAPPDRAFRAALGDSGWESAAT